MRRRRTVLVVDDEQGFHDLFRFVPEPPGFCVRSAYNGPDGLALIRENDAGLMAAVQDAIG